MQWLSYIIFRGLQTLIGFIPFRLLYVFSDIFSFIIQYIVRYRRKTVSRNLKRAFPNKSEKEIKRISRAFYINLCDIALESIKGYSLPFDQISKRYRCLNPEVANEYFDKGQGVIFALSHYANWEWGTQVANYVFLHENISFYKPLSNKYIDKYICKLREAKGMILCSIYQTKFIFRSENYIPRAYFLVGDQSPSSKNHTYWINFLNQETDCLLGIERYAKMYNLPVIYLDIQRIERGRYTIILELLNDNPKETYKGEITQKYMSMLEKAIINKPENWLWSHRRWKRKRTLYGFSEGK